MFPTLFWTIFSSAVLASTELLKLDFTRTPVASALLNRQRLELPMYNDIFHQVSAHAVSLQQLICFAALYRQSNGRNTSSASFSSD